MLLGALSVGVAVAQVNRARAAARLDLAATAVRTALGSLCQRLRVAGETAVLLGAGPAAVSHVVDRQLAAGMRLVGSDGAVRYLSAGLPPTPWADCSGGAREPAGYGAIFARVPLRDSSGSLRAYADAVEPVNEALARRLAAAGHAAVTVLPPTYVAVPFAADADPVRSLDDAASPAALGVLALYDRHGFDEFDDSDLVTLRTFAGQAAVALDNVRVHEEAQRLSLTDPLTGLSNYRYLKESMRREVERASRFGRMLAVLALDLDRFKEVNDAYGHPTGDEVLAELSRRLCAEIREVDFAFRHGGEEFVVLLPETESAGARVLAERLGAAVRRTPVMVAAQVDEPVPIPMTVSIGIAVYPDHATTGDELLQAAGDALYAAKAAGRDTYRMAEPTAPADSRRIVSRHGPA